jgi:hypothetical protein
VNYDLAMMALEGLARAPLALRHETCQVVLEAEAASFKELARLCLLLGGVQTASEEFELTPGVHIEQGCPGLLLRLKGE